MKKAFSAMLCAAIILSGMIMTPTSAETRTAGEAAADVVMSDIYKVKAVLEKDINRTLNKGVGFIDIDFDGQLELWVHRTKRSELCEASNHIFDLEDGRLKEIIAFDDVVPNGGLDSDEFSANPFGTLSLYKDSLGNVFYYVSSKTGGSAPEEAVTWYSMITNESGKPVQKPKFMCVDGEGRSDGNLKHTIYDYYGSVEQQFDVSDRKDFYQAMTDTMSSWEDLELSVNFSGQTNNFLAMSEKEQRNFLISSYDKFSYEGFTRNDDNLGSDFREEPKQQGIPDILLPGSRSTDTDRSKPPRPKTDSSGSDKQSSEKDTDTEIPETDGSYTWHIHLFNYGEEIKVLSGYQPTQKNTDGSWDIYTAGNMLAGPYLAGKYDGKYGLIDYNGAYVEYPQYDRIASGYGGVLVGINDMTDKKTVIANSGGEISHSDYNGELGDAIEGTYYWVLSENKLYEAAADGKAKESDDKRPMVVSMGIKNSDGTVVSARSAQSKISSDKVLVNNGKAVDTLKELKFITDAGCFADGIVPVKNTGGKWGYCDEKGKIVIPFEYDAAWDGFSSDEYGSGSRAYDSSNGYVVLKKNGKYALFTSDGKISFDFGVFDEILPVYSDGTNKYAWVRQGDKWGNIILTTDSGISTDKKNESSDTDSSPKRTIPDGKTTKETGDAIGGSRSKTSMHVLPYVLAVVGVLVIISGASLGTFVLMRKKK